MVQAAVRSLQWRETASDDGSGMCREVRSTHSVRMTRVDVSQHVALWYALVWAPL